MWSYRKVIRCLCVDLLQDFIPLQKPTDYDPDNWFEYEEEQDSDDEFGFPGLCCE